MSALAPNPQTETGVGGAAPPVAGDDFSQYYLPQQMTGFPAGPPAGAPIDSTYLAKEAQNRQNIASQYATELQSLGYTDPQTGQYIPGSLVTNARLAEEQAQQGLSQADLANTQAMQQAGTLFSGMRGQQQALAEAPFLGQIGQTELQLPQDMASHFQTAAGLINAYTTQNNIDLADAATRATAAIDANPPGGPTTPPPGAPTTPPPAAPSSYNPYAYVPGGSSAAKAAAIQNAGYNGPVYMQEGGTVTQPTPAVLGESGPETVVPHENLTADEQMQLQNLAATAQARAAGDILAPQRPVDQGYGPGGVNMRSLPRLPVVNPATYLHENYGLRSPAAEQEAENMWIGHHPGALAGRTQAIPHWVQAAVHERIAAMHRRMID
jgi:hypothetical protein